ncbi:MAG TPA: Hsp33 family molecular chaperone HslO [Bacteroidetes bacterium]|nr:Hsp33 family molecular chaperone HslO [Bacteroidota bacterium]
MNKKEIFLKKDRLIRGITTDGFFKIAVVKSTDVVKLAQEYHNLSLLTTVILGRALTGSLLLASELKGEERIRLHLEGKGPIGTLITEANAIGEARGYVENPDAELDYSKTDNLGDGIGLGVLSFSKSLYNEARPTTGTVELMSGNISDDIAYYLFQSEQVPSAITLDVGIDENGNITHAGGILIQALPGAPENGVLALEENLKKLLPLSTQFIDDQYIDDLMHKVAGPLKIKELGRVPVHFFCRCTKDRFLTALSMLQIHELEEMEHQTQELVCHYCNKKYMITPPEIQKIIQDLKIRLN